jgi:hypothetical protein
VEFGASLENLIGADPGVDGRSSALCYGRVIPELCTFMRLRGRAGGALGFLILGSVRGLVVAAILNTLATGGVDDKSAK